MTVSLEIRPRFSTASLPAPALIAAAGDQARERFFEFFAAQIATGTRAAPTSKPRTSSSPGARITAWSCGRSGLCMSLPTSKPSSAN
jgi:hypothetical protein